MSSVTQSAIVARPLLKPKTTLKPRLTPKRILSPSTQSHTPSLHPSTVSSKALSALALTPALLALLTTLIFPVTSTYAAEASDSITTNLDITVVDSGLEVPKTGFLTEIFGDDAGAIPTVVLPIIALVLLAAIVFIVRRVGRRSRLHSSGPKFHSSRSRLHSSKRALRAVKTAAILLTVASLVITNTPTNYTSAAEPEDKLITLSLTDLPGAIQAEKGATLAEAAKLNLSIATASINDIDIKVVFTSSNPGIELSTPTRTVTLPAGTTSATVPVDVRVSDEVLAGRYTQPIEIAATLQDTFYRTSGRDIIDRHGIKTRLNAMNFFSIGSPYWENEYPRPERITAIHNDFAYAEMEELGINAVRFNFSPRLIADYCTTSACLNYDYSEEVFAQLDQVLQHAANHNIGIFFNFHNAYGVRTGTPANQLVDNWKWNTFLPENIAKDITVWEKIATRFKDDKRIIGFELMNEPMVRLESNQTPTDATKIWDNIAQDMIDAIRVIDTNHIIMVEKIQGAIKNNGTTRENPPAGYLFPNVSDPVSNNLVLAYHDYGAGNYTVQTPARIEAEPWVWPSTDYVGVLDSSQFYADNTIWQSGGWATYTATDSNQDTWTEIKTAPGAVPKKGDKQTNIAHIVIMGRGGFAADTTTYIDDIRVDQYNQDGIFEKTIHTQTFRHTGATINTAMGKVIMDESVCYDAGSGCFKVTGVTNSIADHTEQKRYFKVDPSKKYSISARVHGSNVTTDTPNVTVYIEYSYATEETVRPFDKSYLNTRIQDRVKYSKDHNIPIINTEWGVLTNGEDWDKIGGEQYAQDYLEVFKENGVSAAYFLYYDRNTNATQRRHGLRVREFSMPTFDPLNANNAILNTKLYSAFMNTKD